MLRHLKRVFISFVPGDPRAASARELLQRVGADKAKKSNPKCEVEFKVDDAGEMGKSYVELVFADNDQRKLFTADYRIKDIEEIIQRKAKEAEMQEVMKEVSYDPWSSANRMADARARAMEQQQPAAR
jgi:large subunit ribosomal protein L53